MLHRFFHYARATISYQRQRKYFGCSTWELLSGRIAQEALWWPFSRFKFFVDDKMPGARRQDLQGFQKFNQRILFVFRNLLERSTNASPW